MFWIILAFMEARNKLSENNITNYPTNRNNNEKPCNKMLLL